MRILKLFGMSLVLSLAINVHSEDPAQPDFNWKDESPSEQTGPAEPSIPAKPRSQTSAMNRFEAMRKRMREFQKRFFDMADPFMGDSFFNSATSGFPPAIQPFSSAFQSAPTALPPLSEIRVRDTKRFLIVEVPKSKGDGTKLEFSLQGQYLKIQSVSEQRKETQAQGMQSQSMSFRSASTALSLPVAVKNDFSRQQHKDKIVLTFEKM